jgi:CRISPR-associated protein Csd1
VLHHVVEYARQNVKDSAVGFAPREILWRVRLASDGAVLNIEPVQDRKAKPRRKWSCPDMPKMRGGRAHFLVDMAAFVLGYAKSSPPAFQVDDDEKTLNRHEYFIDLLACAASKVAALGSIATFLRSEDQLARARILAHQQGVNPGDWVAFVVEDYDPSADAAVLDWWRAWLANEAAAESKSAKAGIAWRPVDLLTGTPCSPAATHPPVRGLNRGLGSDGGDAQAPLVAMDKGAFQSFGLDSGANAAMSTATAQLYADGLSDLIDRAAIVAGAKVAYWYRRPLQTDEVNPIMAILSATYSPDADRAGAMIAARNLLDAIRTGQRPHCAGNEYFALTLSGLKGRVMVREWMEGNFADVLSSSLKWFDDLQVVGLAGARMAPEPKFETVVTCMLPERSQSQRYGDWVRPIGPGRIGLLRAALRCEVPIPIAALRRVVDELGTFMISEIARDLLLGATRVKSDDSDGLTVSRLYARMGVIKAYFIRTSQGGEASMQPYLNPEHPEPAYQCGRLLAVLAKLQQAALGDVGAGVVQRYYPAFSQAPALYLGRLVGNARNHLAKLPSAADRDTLDRHLEEIHSRLRDAAPVTLGLEGQGLFALGYYQQLAALRADENS